MDPRIPWVNVYSWYGHSHVKDQCLRPMGNQQSLPHKRLRIGIIFLWSHFEHWQCVQMVATTAAWSRWVLTDREPPPETSWPYAPFVVHKKNPEALLLLSIVGATPSEYIHPTLPSFSVCMCIICIPLFHAPSLVKVPSHVGHDIWLSIKTEIQSKVSDTRELGNTLPWECVCSRWKLAYLNHHTTQAARVWESGLK